MVDTTGKRRWPGPDVAPFKDGNLLEWVHPSDVRDRTTATDHYAIPTEWRDNEPFRATLVLTGIERGRSAARFTWAGTGGHTGNTFPMFMTDVADLMMHPDGVANAVASGWWIVVKRGQNYGIRRLHPNDAPTDGTPSASDRDRELIAAIHERRDADGLFSITDLHRSSLIGASRPWIAARLTAANNGISPLPDVAVTRVSPATWRATFARHCPTCNLFIPDGMAHPHNLTPAVWETP